MEDVRQAARVQVAKPSPGEGAALTPWVAAPIGFLLGSLTGILIGTPVA